MKKFSKTTTLIIAIASALLLSAFVIYITPKMYYNTKNRISQRDSIIIQQTLDSIRWQREMDSIQRAAEYHRSLTLENAD